MSEQNYDLVVLGAGSGGYAAASNKKSRYRFGLGSKKTTETVVVPADNTSINEAAERSSYVRA